MSKTDQSARAVRQELDPTKLLARLRDHFAARRAVRKGVCCLNAGDYQGAERAFSQARAMQVDDGWLPAYLASSQLARGSRSAAVSTLESGSAGDPQAVDSIRTALALWKDGRRTESVQLLRHAIEKNCECGELHFQLGTLLTQSGENEEAELRFTQAVNIDPDHSRAAVSLALCCAARQAPHEAMQHLQRAQAQRPHDPLIGQLLAQAIKATRQAGRMASVRVVMPEDDASLDAQAIAELAAVIENDPEFVDALLSLPLNEIDQDIYALLLSTLQLALQHQPEHAELHFHTGQVLERLGRKKEAIDANERAVEINPMFTPALIRLGKLYQDTNQTDTATTRLEQAVSAGAEYADVHLLLGNLYRASGDTSRARIAYQKALSINEDYQEAKLALHAVEAMCAS